MMVSLLKVRMFNTSCFDTKLSLVSYSYHKPAEHLTNLGIMPPNPKNPERSQNNAPGRYSSKSFWEAVTAENSQSEDQAAKGGETFPQIDEVMMNAPTHQPPQFQTIIASKPLPAPPVERYVRADGKIGVVIGHGFNGGWSSRLRLVLDPSNPANWPRTRKMQEIALFDKDIVTAVLAGDIQSARMVAVEKMELPKQFSPVTTELRVEWLAPGEEFEVLNPVGYERVKLKSLIEFWRA